MRVVIDHVAGTRRGQRQEFAVGARIRFGRHPECEVSFDPQRDIDASSRHAELRMLGGADEAREGEPSWVLVDLGSSNGTYVEGRRITEAAVARGAPISIEFGPGGPRVRLLVGNDAEIEALPPPPVARARPPRWVIAGAAAASAVALLLVLVTRC